MCKGEAKWKWEGERCGWDDDWKVGLIINSILNASERERQSEKEWESGESCKNMLPCNK